jgi:Protein of unknown function (DUF2793)
MTDVTTLPEAAPALIPTLKLYAWNPAAPEDQYALDAASLATSGATLPLEAKASRSIIVDRDLSAPPVSCADKASYIIAASPTGLWAGHAGKMATAIGTDAVSGWIFQIVQVEGYLIYVQDEDTDLKWNGSAWVSANTGGIVAGWNPGVGVKRIMMHDGQNGVDNKLGFIATSAGTTEVPSSMATTNRLTRMNRGGRLSTAANAEYGWMWASTRIFKGNAGYTYEASGGFGVGATMSQKRMFWGMRANAAFPGNNVDPSSFINAIGFGADTADANWQIMHNDGTGTATKTDTGWAKALGDVFYLKVIGTASGIYVYVERFAAANLTMTPTSTFPLTLFSSDVPTASTELAPIFLGWNGATAENGTLNSIEQSIISPF